MISAVLDVIYPYTFCKRSVSSYLSTRQILLVSSIKLYMRTTTKTSSAAASVIPWAFFEENMTPVQMYRIIHQYK